MILQICRPALGGKTYRINKIADIYDVVLKLNNYDHIDSPEDVIDWLDTQSVSWKVYDNEDERIWDAAQQFFKYYEE